MYAREKAVSEIEKALIERERRVSEQENNMNKMLEEKYDKTYSQNNEKLNNND